MGQQTKVRDEINRRVLAGTYQPGGRIDTCRKLADEFSVSTQTVTRAIRELCLRGILFTNSRGCYVSPHEHRASESSERSESDTICVLLPRGVRKRKVELPGHLMAALQPLYGRFLQEGLDVRTLHVIEAAHSAMPYIPVDRIAEHKFRGLVCIDIYDLMYLKELAELGCALVALDVDAGRVGVDSAQFDHGGSTGKLVAAMFADGARKIGFVGGPLSTGAKTSRRFDSSPLGRFNAWRAATTALGLEAGPELLGELENSRQPQDYTDATDRLLAANPDLDAILTESPVLVANHLIETGQMRPGLRVSGWVTEAPPASLRDAISHWALCSYEELACEGAKLLVRRLQEPEAKVLRSVVECPVQAS